MSLRIALSGATVWAPPSRLPGTLGQDRDAPVDSLRRRLVCEAMVTWDFRTGRSLQEHLEEHAVGVLADVFREAVAFWWERHAVTWERVGTEDGDGIADACRAKAQMIRRYGVDGAEETIAAVLAETRQEEPA